MHTYRIYILDLTCQFNEKICIWWGNIIDAFDYKNFKFHVVETLTYKKKIAHQISNILCEI